MKLEKRAAFGWPATAAGSAPCANGLVIHYDGSNLGLAGKSHEACRAYWRNTRRFHMSSARGWVDIGYSFGVCPHGVVLEGRGWQRQQAAQPSGNSTWTSCTFMSGDAEEPTAAQIEAFRELRAWLRGKGLKAPISYHGKFIDTSCPGKILRGLVTSGQLAGSSWMEAMVKKLPTLEKGDTGEDVQTLRALLAARSHPMPVEGPFDDKVVAAVKTVQRWGGVADDGIVGPKTWPVLLRVHK